jgi:hypothetical protein
MTVSGYEDVYVRLGYPGIGLGGLGPLDPLRPNVSVILEEKEINISVIS